MTHAVGELSIILMIVWLYQLSLLLLIARSNVRNSQYTRPRIDGKCHFTWRINTLYLITVTSSDARYLHEKQLNMCMPTKNKNPRWHDFTWLNLYIYWTRSWRLIILFVPYAFVKNVHDRRAQSAYAQFRVAPLVMEEVI